MDLLQTIHVFGLLRRRRNLRKRGIGDGSLSVTQLNILPGTNAGMQPVSSTNGGSNLGSKRLYIRLAASKAWCNSAAFWSPSWLGLGSSVCKASRKAKALTYLKILLTVHPQHQKRLIPTSSRAVQLHSSKLVPDKFLDRLHNVCQGHSHRHLVDMGTTEAYQACTTILSQA
jgi:hypothetical protein